MPPADPAGVYIHVPFCTQRCSYCDFYTLGGGVRTLDRYLGAVEADLERGAAVPPGESRPRADAVFFGGGTPSLLPGTAVDRILAAVRRTFVLSGDAEVTLEMNPESCSRPDVEAYLAAGVNRISLGVQSFHDDILAGVGRSHRAALVREAVAVVRAAGLANLSLDLIAGLPGTDLQGFVEDVDAAVALAPEHASVYMLETDKPTPLARAAAAGRVSIPGEDETAAMFEAALDHLAEAGFEHYEISNFARPGRRSRHNLKYWRGAPVLGVGPSAWSFWRGRRQGRIAHLERYLAALEGGGTAVAEDATLDPEGAACEALYLELRLLDGVDVGSLSRRSGVDLVSRFATVLEGLAADGLLAWDAGSTHARLTRRGVLLANEVFAQLSP